MQLIEFILGIAALILLHELGHFLAARTLNVEVEEFGIGLPPRMVKLFEHKGTIFSLNWIPLGGFVRPKGENDPTVPGGLAAASPWVRLAVISAGPIMNLVIGVILGIMFFYTLGDPIPDQVIVSQVSPGSPAADAGLQPGDLFLTVNGEKVDGIDKLKSLIDANLGVDTTLTMQRGEQVMTVVLVPRANPPEGEGAMGVILDNATRPISLLAASDRGIIVAAENVRGILALPVRMLQGQTKPEEGRLVGYKGMYDIYQRLPSPLYFFMMISISLGIFNLLPIPALDGGRILFILPELLFRRRVPAQYETVIHAIGLAMLLLLLIYINVQDFVNPFQWP
jgi:regulator of sigma E protease